MKVDNTKAVGFYNDTINKKQPKSIIMRYYWIKDRTCQGHSKIYWYPGRTNLGDYNTKHSPLVHY